MTSPDSLAGGVDKCPSCGHISKVPRPRARKEIVYIVVAFAIVIATATVLLEIGLDFGHRAPMKPQPHAELYGEADGAWEAAKKYVRGRLVSPGSAEFGWSALFDHPARERSPGRWTVLGWVDSQNRFGGLIRTRFTCDLQYDRCSGWRLICLDIAER